ncbi:MAG: hypothetical protein AAF653_14655, partial [Chloroflexota bacterium]
MKSKLSIALLAIFLAAFSSIAYAQEDEYVDPCVAEDAMMEESDDMAEMADNSDTSFHIILPNARGDRSF